MQNALQIFQKEEYPIEVIFLDGEPLFNARQVGEGLMITDSSVRDAVRDMGEHHKRLVTQSEYGSCSNVDLTDIRNFPNRGKVYLRESGLYRLIFQSRKPEAEVFKDWLAMEVLPALRKTGSYGVAQAPQTFAEALRMLADKVEETERAKEQLQLVSGKLIETEHDRQVLSEIVEPQGYIRLGDAAKIIGHPRLGPNNIFKFLVSHGVLMKCWHVEKPYSFYARYDKYFRMRATRQNGGHTNLPYSQVVVNFAGLKWIMKKAVEVLGPWNGLMSLPEIAAQFRQSLEQGDDVGI